MSTLKPLDLLQRAAMVTCQDSLQLDERLEFNEGQDLRKCSSASGANVGLLYDFMNNLEPALHPIETYWVSIPHLRA